MVAVAGARDRRDLKACPMFQSRLSVFLGAYLVIGFAVGLIVFAKSQDAQTGFTETAGPAILAGAIWPVTVFVKILEGF
jgi:hypothetical protein